ncbi:MAG: hypothetical protein LIO57_04130 [Oscillospiraceae bacterium]|nr:hypothetical protein [Oscillospiraceae bacterium]
MIDKKQCRGCVYYQAVNSSGSDKACLCLYYSGHSRAEDNGVCLSRMTGGKKRKKRA